MKRLLVKDILISNDPCILCVTAYCRHREILWNHSQPTSPVFYNMKSVTDAGFDYVHPQPNTKIIVTRHPKLPGYIIKAYLDVQEYYDDRPEYYYFQKRAEGARLIQEAIDHYGFSHLLKVPTKWIYLLPDTPYKEPPEGCFKKQCVLVEDDMEIVSDKENKALWASKRATKELLAALHTIITDYRFRDLAKPANCPFAKDGRVALVDTQSFYKKHVGYYKLTRALSPEMQEYWESLSHVAMK